LQNTLYLGKEQVNKTIFTPTCSGRDFYNNFTPTIHKPWVRLMMPFYKKMRVFAREKLIYGLLADKIRFFIFVKQKNGRQESAFFDPKPGFP
jgi:hypothetical protein